MSRYDDIIKLPHHVSKTRPPMSMHERAAQFSPFAALTGFGAAITETARLTEEKAELDESGKDMIDERLRALHARIVERPKAAFTYFVPDARKAGGAYITVTGAVKRIDDTEKAITLTDGTVISMDDLYAVDEV